MIQERGGGKSQNTFYDLILEVTQNSSDYTGEPCAAWEGTAPGCELGITEEILEAATPQGHQA